MNFKDYIQYHDSGVITWKKKTGRSTQIGKSIGVKNETGYLTVRIDGRRHCVHRIIWEMHNGPIPHGMHIDHINHVRDDNRIENLRLVLPSGNAMNKSQYENNKSGRVGVCQCKRSGRWRATITVGGVHIALGVHENINDAIAAREEAELKYGFHRNHGL